MRFLLLFCLLLISICSISFANAEQNISSNTTQNISINQSVNVTINQSINLTVNRTIVPKCNISLSLTTNKDLTHSGEKFKIYNRMSSKKYGFILEYWVEDLFGNIVKRKLLTTNTNAKQFTPKINEKDQVLIVKNRLVHVDCLNNRTQSTNHHTVIVINNKTDIFQNESNITVKSNLKNGFIWGESKKIDIEVYRGETRKYAIKMWIHGKEKISDVSTFHIRNKFQKSTIGIPIQLKSNCKQRYENGTYFLKIEGLGINVTRTVDVEGNAKQCQTNVIEKEIPIFPKTNKSKFIFDIVAGNEMKSGDSYGIFIENNHNESHVFTIESYALKGKEQFSKQQTERTIHPLESQQVFFQLNLENGTYKLMGKIKVDDQKTIRSVSKKISFRRYILNNSCSYKDIPLCIQQNITKPTILTGNVIYDTNRVQTKLTPSILIIALGLVVLGILFTKAI